MTRTTDTELMRQLQAAAKPLVEAWPLAYLTQDQERSAASDRRNADLATQGIVTSVYNGVHEVNLGREGIDWESVRSGRTDLMNLKRMGMLAPLLRAWRETGESRYPEAMVYYIREYIRHNPTGDCPNMEVGIRGTNIADALHHLVDSEAADAAFFAETVAYLTREMNWLHDNLAVGINWRVHCTRGLLICAQYLSFLPESAAWTRTSVAALNDAWTRQFLPDGVHYERNPIYHIGMASTYYKLWRLAQVRPDLGLQMDLARLNQSYAFVAACARPNGWISGIHDSQGNHAGHADRAGGQTAVAGQKSVRPLRVWQTYREGTGQALDLPPTSQFFPDAGLGSFRTSWDEDAQWVSFDATRWGGAHCHFSRNALQLHAHRRTMVIDPGWLSYGADKWGQHGRSTPAHSTCTFDDLNQSQANPSVTRYLHAPGYDCVFSKYDGGYWQTAPAWNLSHAGHGLFAEHGRTMLWVQGRFLFVADSLFRLPRSPGDPEAERPSAACNWQLSADATVELAADASRAVARWPEATLLLLCPIRPAGTVLTMAAGQEEPIRGWVPGEAELEPAPHLSFAIPRMDKQHEYVVSVLIPSAGDTVPDVEVEATSPNGQIGHLTLRWADGGVDEIHWGCGFEMAVGQVGALDTDSSMVHIRREPDGRTHGVALDATYCRPHNADTHPHRQAITFGPQ